MSPLILYVGASIHTYIHVDTLQGKHSPVVYENNPYTYTYM